MAIHLHPNVNDFLSNLDTYIYELFDVKPDILDCSHLILYGNDMFYLAAYARAIAKNCFELDDVDAIKDIVMNKNIAGKKHIFVMRKHNNLNKLKSLLEVDNARFVILTRTIGHIEANILSRCCLMRLAFNKEKITEFLQRHYQLKFIPHKSLICNLSENKIPKFKQEFDKLITFIKKNKNELEIVNNIREYCHNVFQMGLPMNELAKMIIETFKEHEKIYDIVEICAEIDHNAKGILGYEALFLRLYKILYR